VLNFLIEPTEEFSEAQQTVSFSSGGNNLVGADNDQLISSFGATDVFDLSFNLCHETQSIMYHRNDSFCVEVVLVLICCRINQSLG
jgi:hypothetical protein